MAADSETDLMFPAPRKAKIDGIATTPISLISLLWQAHLWLDVDRRLVTGSGFGDR
jgi:hypothetical protein